MSVYLPAPLPPSTIDVMIVSDARLNVTVPPAMCSVWPTSGCGTAPVALLTSVRLSGIDAGGVNVPSPVIVSVCMPSTSSGGQTNVTPAGTWIVTSPAMVSVDFPSASGSATVIVPSSNTVPPVQPLRFRRISSPPPRFVRTHGSSALQAVFCPFVRMPSTISLPPSSMLNTQSGLQWLRCE